MKNSPFLDWAISAICDNSKNKDKNRPGGRENCLKGRLVLLVYLMGFVVLFGFGLAAGDTTPSDTTQVQATIDPIITLAVPGSITDLTLTPGDDNTRVLEGLAVTTNAPWHIFVQSAKDSPESGNDYYGHFWSPTAHAAGHGALVDGHGPGFMTNAVVLNADADLELSDDPAPLASGETLGTTPVPFTMKQTAAWDDVAANDYRIVLQFTASN
ncbi:Uncharacterised protein [uncultured archaeon]|nr:Uncharacterised protein [uncultured archaeon]